MENQRLLTTLVNISYLHALLDSMPSLRKKALDIKRHEQANNRGRCILRNQNQFYFRRKNSVLTEQQLACDKGEAAKGSEWYSS